MQPLVITATPNICWLKPDVDYPQSVEALVDEAIRCEKAGASVLHIHAEGRWVETIRALRSRTDLVIQCGMSSLEIPKRMEVFEERADMISIITSHHDEAFAQVDCHALHPREELEDYARLSAQYGVALEYEIWHTGSIWNLNYLIERGLVPQPYFTTLFFGWPGGSWSPPTLEEYIYRRRYMPAGSVMNVSVMGAEQSQLLAASVQMGDHVRVGTEDYPYDRSGKISATYELVAEIAGIAKALGRPVATPEQARKLTLPVYTTSGS